MGDRVELEIVPDDGSPLSDELLLDIVVIDYSTDTLRKRPLITEEEFRVSRGLLTSEKSSKSLILQLLSETVLPECYYSDGIESEMVEKIRDMMLRSPDRDGIEAELVKKVRGCIIRGSRHRDDADVVLPHMSIHIILHDDFCRYYVINGVRFVRRSDLLFFVFLTTMRSLGAYSGQSSSSSRPKKKVKIQSEEGSCLECSICLQEIMSQNEANGLPCSHVYHRTCIAKWLQRSGVCPLCRCKVSLFP